MQTAKLPPLHAQGAVIRLREPGEAWAILVAESRAEAESGSLLSRYLSDRILVHSGLEEALARHLADCISGPGFASADLARAFYAILIDPAFRMDHVFEDMAAFMSRDPACARLYEVILFYKGFQALQLHRIANFLWKSGETGFARHINYRSSVQLAVDIHPAAQIDAGIFIDHATGVVIGETSIVGKGVSMMQDVTLGGTGKETGRRHPEICSGVLIGAGAKILGNIKIGPSCRIGAGTIVLKDAPAGCTIVGVPGRIVGRVDAVNPASAMNHNLT